MIIHLFTDPYYCTPQMSHCPRQPNNLSLELHPLQITTKASTLAPPVAELDWCIKCFPEWPYLVVISHRVKSVFPTCYQVNLGLLFLPRLPRTRNPRMTLTRSSSLRRRCSHMLSLISSTSTLPLMFSFLILSFQEEAQVRISATCAHLFLTSPLRPTQTVPDSPLFDKTLLRPSYHSLITENLIGLP